MITPQELETHNRLIRIFTPYALWQMNAFFESQHDKTHPRFVHYTSAEAALKIIQNKCLWMRNITCMSDYSEVQHGFFLLNSIFKEPSNRSAFNEALSKCAPGSGEAAVKLFDEWWADTRLNTYITSISEHDDTEDRHGRLSMWRAFGGGTARVAIVFKVPLSLLTAGVFNLTFSPVAYLTEGEVKDKFLEVVKNIRDNSDFLKSVGHQIVVNYAFGMLSSGVTCMKHEGFREEREWRLVYAPNRMPSELITPSTEVVSGIPQRVHNIPLDKTKSESLSDFDLARIFDRLIIGPTQYAWPMVETFATALGKLGVTEPEKRVVVSGIPIRT